MNKKILNKKDSGFSKIIASFKDKWVAVTPDYSEVVASAHSLAEVTRKIGEKRSELTVFRVVPFDVIYSPVDYEI